MWRQWTNAVLGLVVLVVPFLGLTSTVFMWTLVTVGLAVTILAVWGASQETQEKGERSGSRLQHQ